jgi:hypothetical protein
MIEVNPKELQTAVETMHGARAKLIRSMPVVETFQEETVWQGIVHMFELTGHSTATLCYAWSSPVEGSDKQRFFAVLHIPPITSPQDAVRAEIVQEFRTDNSR